MIAPHERLVVYQRALQAATILGEIADAVKETRPDLRDQLARASASVVLNVAEGADEFTAREKSRFFRMARRSSAECLAILDLLAALRLAPAPSGEVRDQLLQISAMLTTLVRRQAVK